MPVSKCPPTMKERMNMMCKPPSPSTAVHHYIRWTRITYLQRQHQHKLLAILDDDAIIVILILLTT
eukprot:scaffold13818_cov78-Skeletonema_dohrnii-CCMP3373.AAC.2